MTDSAVTTFVDPEITAAMQVYDRLKPLQNALGLDDLTVAEMQLFAMVAHRTGLDPFTRQIYAIKRKGKVVHQTGIDGYRSVAEGTGGYAGSDEAEYEDCPCGKEPPHPALARVVVHRILSSGHVVNQPGIARWHELYPGEGGDGFMWRQMPYNQLAKCAEANALRKAFPRVLGDVYITEEMEQAGPPQNAILVEAASKPDPRSRLAARRAAIEGEVVEVTPEPSDGMTGEAFKALLAEHRISPEYALGEARHQWSDFTWETATGPQLAELADFLTADVPA